MKVKCPTCQQDVEWSSSSKYRPFCSKKCQLIDLGEWADEEKVISSPKSEADAMSLDPEDIEAMLSEQHNDFFKH